MNSVVARNVEAIMRRKCLKQSAIAEKAGYTKQQFNAMLKGRRVIRDTDIMKIAYALDVDANMLFDQGATSMKPREPV